MPAYCIRHATRNEVLAFDGWVTRARPTHRGVVEDDISGMEFHTPQDAEGFLAHRGMTDEGHHVVVREEVDALDLAGGTGQYKGDYDPFGLGGSRG